MYSVHPGKCLVPAERTGAPSVFSEIGKERRGREEGLQNNEEGDVTIMPESHWPAKVCSEFKRD